MPMPNLCSLYMPYILHTIYIVIIEASFFHFQRMTFVAVEARTYDFCERGFMRDSYIFMDHLMRNFLVKSLSLWCNHVHYRKTMWVCVYFSFIFLDTLHFINYLEYTCYWIQKKIIKNVKYLNDLKSFKVLNSLI